MNQIGKDPDDLIEQTPEHHIEKLKELRKEHQEIKEKIREHEEKLREKRGLDEPDKSGLSIPKPPIHPIKLIRRVNNWLKAKVVGEMISDD